MVGTLDGVVLAYGLAHLSDRPGRPHPGRVDELLVPEPARAVGLGEAVLAAWWPGRATTERLGVDATALPGDRHAKNFFESAGFTARRLVMHTSSPGRHHLTPGRTHDRHAGRRPGATRIATAGFSAKLSPPSARSAMGLPSADRESRPDDRHPPGCR